MFICIKCGYPEVDDDDEYCRNCGFHVNGNYCTNIHCHMNNGEPIAMADQDCFCPMCGSKTVFYAAGLIKPQTYNHE